MKVAILGASDKPDRFAYKAQKLLIENGHETYPISLAGKDILDREGYSSIQDIPETERPIHTVTVYMNPTRFSAIADEVEAFQPARIIFNPGTESDEIAERFRKAGVEVVEDCTLVMLHSGTF